jgi:hypothetical protein
MRRCRYWYPELNGGGLGDRSTGKRRGNDAAETTPDPGRGTTDMNEEFAALSTDLRRFAIELRSLAYTTPAGHEDKFVALSERILQRVGPNRS